MSRSAAVSLLSLVLALFLVSALLLNLNGCGISSPKLATFSDPPPAPTPSATPPPTPSLAQPQIQHVVIIVQENRTPDNLFQDPVLIARGADIASSGLKSTGATIPLVSTTLSVAYDIDHSHYAFKHMYDGGKMDGADKETVACYTTCPANPQFAYVRASDVAPYFQLAEQYTFGDHMFQTNQGPSFPAHQFLIAGTSAPTATSTSFMAENTNKGTGCAAIATAWVAVINAAGKESATMYPCAEHRTLTDELDAKHLSWRYYAPSAGSIWTGPNAIHHMCQPQTKNGVTACSGSDWNNVIIPSKQVLTDIANHQLPAVTWIIPAGQNSDHAGVSGGNGGPSWVASIVNAIGTSSYWSNTAIIITWDDWGGWYDHVPPPMVINDGISWGSGYVYGFRVPLIVVSPFAKAGFISHANHDFGSILNFIEQTFSLSSLGYADALSDCFDLTQPPIPFRRVAAPLSADYFIHDSSPQLDPDTD